MIGRLVPGILAATMLLGCTQKQADSTVAGGELDKVVVAAAPVKAPQDVLAVKKDATSGDPVVIEGKIKDFVDGAAVFTLVDNSLKSCKDRSHGCTTPWDYCCEDGTKVAEGSATVKVMGPDNQPVLSSIKGVRKLDHLTPVAVEGKAVKDAQGNLTVEATKIYIKS